MSSTMGLALVLNSIYNLAIFVVIFGTMGSLLLQKKKRTGKIIMIYITLGVILSFISTPVTRTFIHYIINEWDNIMGYSFDWSFFVLRFDMINYLFGFTSSYLCIRIILHILTLREQEPTKQKNCGI